MAENTSIEWCDHTFNPWIGCTRVSTAAAGGGGCDNCYAAVSTPARAMGIAWGAGQPRHRTAGSTWRQPLHWNARHAEFFAAHGRRQRVFCASLADVFDNEVPQAWRDDLFALILGTPNLDWLLLTKRIGNAARMLPWSACSEPWPNVWLGATVVNQEEADRDIPKLLAVLARVRFLSIEPMLGRMYIEDIPDPAGGVCLKPLAGLRWVGDGQGRSEVRSLGGRIDWVIVGGESGHGARPMHPAWASSLRDQCAAAGVPFLFKQWGEWMPIGQQGNGDGPGCSDYSGYSKAPRCVLQLDGEVHDAWPAGAMLMRRIGKKAAGRLLDGRQHNAFPEASTR